MWIGLYSERRAPCRRHHAKNSAPCCKWDCSHSSQTWFRVLCELGSWVLGETHWGSRKYKPSSWGVSLKSTSGAVYSWPIKVYFTPSGELKLYFLRDFTASGFSSSWQYCSLAFCTCAPMTSSAPSCDVRRCVTRFPARGDTKVKTTT